jgi:hypothetical protein
MISFIWADWSLIGNITVLCRLKWCETNLYDRLVSNICIHWLYYRSSLILLQHPGRSQIHPDTFGFEMREGKNKFLYGLHDPRCFVQSCLRSNLISWFLLLNFIYQNYTLPQDDFYGKPYSEKII